MGCFSYTQNGDPYENALAERMNGILKGEFLLYGFPSHEKAKQVIDRSIRDYNAYRPHSSLDYLTPIQAHQKEGRLPKRWRKKEYQKVDSNINPP
ncbi:integrase core domain-containing protein [Flexithrix dorotheae]|uniref:integrase core domain-containing protein n=1 Tax=Flexithrix dorotheae TaxID=70993 RepID=UPI00035C392F|nr:integrase core domain-containing protein [Flexithrix dorotheae]